MKIDSCFCVEKGICTYSNISFPVFLIGVTIPLLRFRSIAVQLVVFHFENERYVQRTYGSVLLLASLNRLKFGQRLIHVFFGSPRDQLCQADAAA